MFIYELEVGETVSLTVKMKEKESFDWKCEVLQTLERGRCILVEPLMHDGMLINFDDANISAELVAIRDGKPVIFRSCHLQYLKTKDNSYHAIATKEVGVNLNRRQYFRVTVDEYCYVNYGKATVDAFLIDVSYAGFGFVVNHWDNADMGQVMLTFRDRDFDKEVVLTGRVVRRVDREDGSTVFGCTMIPKPATDAYVNMRQRKNISSKAGR